MLLKKLVGIVASGSVALGAMLAVNVAHAADDEDGSDFWRINVGARGWFNTWTTWFTVRQFTDLDFDDVVDPVEDSFLYWPASIDSDSRKMSVIPQLSVQVGDFLLAGSYMAKTKYKFTLPNPFDETDPFKVKTERKEFDVNLGYYFVPGVAASLGYKSMTQTFGGAKYKFSGPVAGISGSVPIGGNFGFYASFSYGALRLKDADGDKYDTAYALAEPGISYMIPTGNFAGLDAVVLTLGYRIQSMKTKDSDHDYIDVGNSLRDLTQGVSLGFSASF